MLFRSVRVSWLQSLHSFLSVIRAGDGTDCRKHFLSQVSSRFHCLVDLLREREKRIPPTDG